MVQAHLQPPHMILQEQTLVQRLLHLVRAIQAANAWRVEESQEGCRKGAKGQMESQLCWQTEVTVQECGRDDLCLRSKEALGASEHLADMLSSGSGCIHMGLSQEWTDTQPVPWPTCLLVAT